MQEYTLLMEQQMSLWKYNQAWKAEDTEPWIGGSLHFQFCLYLTLHTPLEGIKRVFKASYIHGSKLPTWNSVFLETTAYYFPKL